MDLDRLPTDQRTQSWVEIASDPYIQTGMALFPYDTDKAIAFAKKIKESGNLTDDEIERFLSLSATLFMTTAMDLINQANNALTNNRHLLVKASIAANAEARSSMEQLQQTRERRKKKVAARKNLKQSRKAINNPKVQDILRAV